MNAADTEARKVLWATLIFATVCSLAANITHSIRLHHGGWAAVGPVLLAMLAPVALLALFHLLGVWARRAGYRSFTYWVFLVAILGLGAAAFRLSFAAIRDLAMEWGYGYADAALFPLILDGLIAVCTVGLVAVQRPRKDAKHEADGAVVHPVPVHLGQEPPVQAADESPEPVYAPEPVHQVAQPSVVQQPEIAPETVVQADAPAVTSDDVVVHQPTRTVHLPAETETVQAPERPRLVAVQADTAVVQAHQSSETEMVRESADTAPVHVRREAKPAAMHQPADDTVQAPEVLPVHLEQAEAVVQRGGTELEVERIAEVYARKDAGESQNSIAKTVPANKRTVAKVLTARAELDADPDSDQTA